jgi:endonuclease/exonuclease/phosphatase family metal-dependent hydrolase
LVIRHAAGIWKYSLGNSFTAYLHMGAVSVQQNPENVFIVYNVHLDHKSQESREKGIGLVWNTMMGHRRKWGLPALLMGDLSTIPNNPAVRYLAEAELDDGSVALKDASAALPYGQVGCTYHGFSGETAGEPVSYVFVTPEIDIMHTEIDRRQIDGGYPSDHYPVIVKVCL